MRDLVPSLQDIQPVVPYDADITVEEYDIVTGIKVNDRKNGSDPAEVITMKATVEQKVQVTAERIETRAKGGTPSKPINPLIHFGNDTPPSRIEIAPYLFSLMHATAAKSFESVNSFSQTFTQLFLPINSYAHSIQKSI
ncbi:hypothetical protein ACOME3_007043 [Neoechinorhynchus agilis]